jgi:NAD(P)-dependent dehydrogenase (short-subunit alcohol dehydrogenase family)
VLHSVFQPTNRNRRASAQPGWSHLRGRASLLPLDLGDLASVRDALADLNEPFDAVVLNAGIAPSDPKLTKQKLEAAFQVNFLGHYYLAKGLLRKGLLPAESNVVVVTSETHRIAPALSLHDFGLPRNFSFHNAMFHCMTWAIFSARFGFS